MKLVTCTGWVTVALYDNGPDAWLSNPKLYKSCTMSAKPHWIGQDYIVDKCLAAWLLVAKLCRNVATCLQCNDCWGWVKIQILTSACQWPNYIKMLPLVFSTIIGEAHRMGQDSILSKCPGTWWPNYIGMSPLISSAMIGEEHQIGHYRQVPGYLSAAIPKCPQMIFSIIVSDMPSINHNDWSPWTWVGKMARLSILIMIHAENRHHFKMLLIWQPYILQSGWLTGSLHSCMLFLYPCQSTIPSDWTFCRWVACKNLTAWKWVRGSISTSCTIPVISSTPLYAHIWLFPIEVSL